MNIEYSMKNIGGNTLIEAHLIGPVRNDDWITFFDYIAIDLDKTERLYILVNENQYESDINYHTANTLLLRAANAPIKEFIVSFSTSDPLKIHLEKLFNVMAKVSKVPLAISYRLSLAEARNVISCLCLSCYTKMTSVVKKNS